MIAFVASVVFAHDVITLTFSLLFLTEQTLKRHPVIVLFSKNVVREALPTDLLPLTDEFLTKRPESSSLAHGSRSAAGCGKCLEYGVDVVQLKLERQASCRWIYYGGGWSAALTVLSDGSVE
jgi:hypothetical protein